MGTHTMAAAGSADTMQACASHENGQTCLPAYLEDFTKGSLACQCQLHSCESRLEVRGLGTGSRTGTMLGLTVRLKHTAIQTLNGFATRLPQLCRQASACGSNRHQGVRQHLGVCVDWLLLQDSQLAAPCVTTMRACHTYLPSGWGMSLYRCCWGPGDG